ncbi:TIR domain-containing protein [Nitrosovibrio tenuis]|uniref:Chromosomal replication initiation ATPase DnaA n=1 Tax=Nitrosovibrio tenuis TaxID=1233 RepID=A0A1H7RXX3_9PROT|nr:TIR domain-containing protein [Nitrosovibrio tenuis]SEL65083.1 Chromosomal replication initiation ATPase DnaA [Nitrosovibrio tenuis]
MSKKVFISYSHKDESYKDALDEHLSMLKRNNIIEAWHDRKIVPGQDWSKEISENLEQSELILFLISPSFLGSEYCFNVEMKRAIEMHKEGRTQLIPIVIRPCDWALEGLSGLQAVPKDAKPITTWQNSDEAWLDAINGIKRNLASFKPPMSTTSTEAKNKHIQVSEAMLEWMEDTEVVLTHRKVSEIKLSDIYISPDLETEELAESKGSTDRLYSSSDIVFAKPKRYLIYGEEQQGKTSLLKQAFKQFLKSGNIPIYLEAKDINRSDITKSLTAALKIQYVELGLEQFLAMPNKVLLIDDLDGIGLNTKYRAIFLDSVNAVFTKVVMSSHLSFSYIAPEIQELNDYEKHELLGLGHIKRAEIVEKWVSLGNEESIDERTLYDQCDESKARLDTIIRRNIVPPKPIYILMLLQMFEAYAQQNLELSSHGHCYQQLIYQAFDNAKIPKDEIDKYLNVLSELSWVLHKNGGAINQHQLEAFFREYEKTYLPVDGLKVINKLKSNSILTEKDFKVQFKYPYLFYFFTAKKIADSFSTNSDVQEEVSKLIANLHREDYANILVFVTHHTKEAWVLQEIQKALSLLFSDQQPATLSKGQLAFMDEFIAQIPELVMEKRVISDERRKHNKRLDDIDNGDIDTEGTEGTEGTECTNDVPANINKAFKGMEISGQIIRNRHATLTRDTMFGLASNGAFTGLRFLNFFIHLSETAKLEVIKYIEQKLKAQPKLSNEEVQDYAKNVFLLMTYGVIKDVIRKIASSIGSKEAKEIYASIQKNDQSPALLLLNQAIELHFNRNLEI